jgi:hypothetical protein
MLVALLGHMLNWLERCGQSAPLACAWAISKGCSQLVTWTRKADLRHPASTIVTTHVKFLCAESLRTALPLNGPSSEEDDVACTVGTALDAAVFKVQISTASLDVRETQRPVLQHTPVTLRLREV